MVDEYQNQAYAANDWSMIDIKIGILLVIVKEQHVEREAGKSGPQLVLIKRMN